GQFLDHDMDLTPTLSGRITAASWSEGIVTITVADGLFRVGDTIKVSGMVPTGFNTPTGGTGTDTILTAIVNTDHSTTLTYARAAHPGPATTFGTVANTVTKDGSNGFPIPVDPTHTDDPIHVPGQPDVNLAFTRSIFDPTTGITTPRQQINVSTSFLDLSQVYGSTTFVAHPLRTHSDGLLKSSPGANGVIGDGDDLLPFNTTDSLSYNNDQPYFTQAQLDAFGMANDAHLVSSDELFVAGDPRANETIELTSLHTLFLRNHNRLAAPLAQQNPADFRLTNWTHENLYPEARKLNIPIPQNIVYN